jgi:hypothetical protein
LRNIPFAWLRGEARARWSAVAPIAASPAERLDAWTTSPELSLAATYSALSARGMPLRCADPTGDDELMAFVATIPIETLNCDRRYRGLFHRMIEPWVTPRIAARRTKASLGNFTIPRTPALRDLARARCLVARGLVDATELAKTFDGVEDITPLWGTLALEAWLRRQS